MNAVVSEIHATGSDIEPIIAILEQVLAGESRAHSIMACLSMVLILQKPDIPAEDLVDAVRETSQFICMLLGDESDDSPEDPSIIMN